MSDNLNNENPAASPAPEKSGGSPFFKKQPGFGRSGKTKRSDDPQRKFFRQVLFFSLGTIAAAFLAAVLTFILALEGEEETMVPRLQGMELANAVIELQDKGLYATVQLRFSDKFSDKGTVLEQDPLPGVVVKAKSEVLLRVSKGAAVEKLENYVGWNIQGLESHLKSLESALGPFLKLKKPYIRVYDESPPGTILAQKPEAGTELTVLTELELVVSKGPEGQIIEMPDYTGMPWREAMDSVLDSGYPFVFTVTREEEGESGTIVSQSPPPKSDVPAETLRQLLLKAPEELEENYRFGIIERDLPDYPVPVPIRVEIIRPGGEIEEMLSFSHRGGLLTIPYVEEINSTIVVKVENEEILRLRVSEPKLQ